jgi:hypothetical protein
MSHQQPHPQKSGVLHLFKKCPLWLAVALMMLGIVAYVLTLDESEVPVSSDEVPPVEMPADAP